MPLPDPSVPTALPTDPDPQRAVRDAFDALPPRRQVKAEDLGPLRAALEAGGSPDQLTGTGHNLLGLAVFRTCQVKRKGPWPVPPLVALLLEFGANPNRPVHPDHPETALYHAAHGPSADLVNALLDAGANPTGRTAPAPASPHRQDDRFRAALHNPYDAATVQRLVQAGADPEVTDKNGDTPLHTARRADVVHALVAAGADPDRANRVGETPLHTARDPLVLRALLDAGADPSRRTPEGNTPLDARRQELQARIERQGRLPSMLAQRDQDNPLPALILLLEGAELRSAIGPDAPREQHPRPRL